MRYMRYSDPISYRIGNYGMIIAAIYGKTFGSDIKTTIVEKGVVAERVQ